MVAPVLAWRDHLARGFGLRTPLAITTAYYLVTLIVLPTLAVGLATIVSDRWGGVRAKRWEAATRFSYALVPIGFSMWLAHYGYHLMTSYRTAIPAAQRFATGLGWPVLGEPAWGDSCCLPAPEWLPRFEIVCLDLGLLLSLYTGYQIALERRDETREGVRPLGAHDRPPVRDRRLDRPPADADARDDDGGGMMQPGGVRLLAIGLGAALLSFAWAAAARGDGGTLRAWTRRGAYEIAVFTEPTPVTTGTVDVSVLLLDAATGGPVPEACVTVDVLPCDRPDMTSHHPATTDAATNKLLRAAAFDLRASGRCEVRVAVDGPRDHAQVRFELEVANSSAVLSSHLPWILWPLPIIALYGFHRRLVRSRGGARPGYKEV